MNTFPVNFGPEGAGDGRFYRTASGDWILDGGACNLNDTMKTDRSDLTHLFKECVV